MNKFIKKIFNDDSLDFDRFPEKSSNAARLARERGKIYEQLSTCLDPEDMKLFREYIEKTTDIEEENEYRAFCAGLRCAARFFIGVFSDQ